MHKLHQPVLLEQVIRLLNPKSGQSFFDGTAGYGGHAAAILAAINDGRAVLADRDADAIGALTERFSDQAEIIHGNYLEVAESKATQNEKFDMILLDLGVSSPQLDQALRGFSFKAAGPLDMRMDQSAALTASEVVNNYPEGRLKQIIREYGEERRAGAVAKAIVMARPFDNTADLANVIRRAVGPGRKGEINPATRTFQAIRIEVNAELENLKQSLPILARLLGPAGRLGVISFHSLEDRIVKNFFQTESKDCLCPPKQPVCTCSHQASLHILTPKPISGDQYDVNNPRARSAKLRAAEKIKTNEEGI